MIGAEQAHLVCTLVVFWACVHQSVRLADSSWLELHPPRLLTMLKVTHCFQVGLSYSKSMLHIAPIEALPWRYCSREGCSIVP